MAEDLSDLTVETADFAVPNHKATREREYARPSFLRSPNKESRAPRAPRAPKQRREVPNKPGQFVEPLTKMYAGLAAVTMPFDNELAATILVQTEDCASSLDKLAQENEAVRRALSSLTTAGVVSAVIMAHFPILLVALKNHTPVLSRFTDDTPAWFRTFQEADETVPVDLNDLLSKMTANKKGETE